MLLITNVFLFTSIFSRFVSRLVRCTVGRSVHCTVSRSIGCWLLGACNLWQLALFVHTFIHSQIFSFVHLLIHSFINIFVHSVQDSVQDFFINCLHFYIPAHINKKIEIVALLTVIPTAFKMSSFPRRGGFCPHYGNHSRWTAVLTKLCMMQCSDVRNMCWVFLFQKN